MTDLHPSAARVVKAAEAKGCRLDPVSDFGLLLDLHRAACAAAGIASAEQRMAELDLPVNIGGVRLWRLSPAAAAWLGSDAPRLFASDPDGMTAATIWSLANSRNPAAFAELISSPSPALDVMRWYKALPVSADALLMACDILLSRAQEDGPTKDGRLRRSFDGAPLLGSSIALLMAEYGQTEAHWLWECSAERFTACLRDAIERRARKDGCRAPDPDSPVIRATAEFARLARVIHARAAASAEVSDA